MDSDEFGADVALCLQKPLTSAKKSTKKLTDLCDKDSLSSSKPFANNLQRDQLQQSAAYTTGTRDLNQSGIEQDFDAFIRYGRLVRFQAADGGYLLVESDGCVRKVPKEFASDQRTLLMLFPKDPIANVGKQKRIRSGDQVFVVQGAPSLHTEHGIAHADSDEMIEGPKHLVDEVNRHDEAASALMDQQTQRQTTKHPPHLSRQAIRMKQLEQTAFVQERKFMPSTVWCLQKVPRTAADASSRSPNDGSDHHLEAKELCFRDGNQIQILQNTHMVCYEMQLPKEERLVRHSATPSGTSSKDSSCSNIPDTKSPAASQLSEGQSQEVGSSPRSAGETTSSFTHVWLHDSATFSSYHPTKCSCHDASKKLWENTWTIRDIEAEEYHKSAQPVLHEPSLCVPQPLTRRTKSPSPSGNIESGKASVSGSDVPPHEKSESVTPEKELDEEEQTAVFNADEFCARGAEVQQTRAARIIVRFFRRMYRDTNTQSRVKEFLRRRRRLTHTKKNLDVELNTAEQERLLQCYNPNVYGSRRAATPLTRNHQSRGGAFVNSSSSAGTDRRKLATLKCEVDLLNQDWLRTEQLPIGEALRPQQMYSKRPLSSPLTPKRLRANRGKEHQFHIEMMMAKRGPPTFHYGGAQTRPRTAPTAIDPLHHQASTSPFALQPISQHL